MTLRSIKLHLTPAHSSPVLVRLGWSERQLPADTGQVGMQKWKGDLPFPVQLCFSQIRLTRLTQIFWLWIFSFHWMCWMLLKKIYSLQKPTYIFTGANMSLYEWTLCVSPACPVGIPEGKWSSLLDAYPGWSHEVEVAIFLTLTCTINHRISKGCNCLKSNSGTCCGWKKQDPLQ